MDPFVNYNFLFTSFEADSPNDKKVSMKFLSVRPSTHIRIPTPTARRTNSCRSYNGSISSPVSERDNKLGRSSSSSSGKQQRLQKNFRFIENEVCHLFVEFWAVFVDCTKQFRKPGPARPPTEIWSTKNRERRKWHKCNQTIELRLRIRVIALDWIQVIQNFICSK